MITDENALTEEDKENYIITAKMNLKAIKDLFNLVEKRIDHSDTDCKMTAAWIINTISIHSQAAMGQVVSLMEPVIDKKKVN